MGPEVQSEMEEKRMIQPEYILIETMQEDLREKRMKMSKVSDNYGTLLNSCFPRRLRRKQRERKQRCIQIHNG